MKNFESQNLLNMMLTNFLIITSATALCALAYYATKLRILVDDRWVHERRDRRYMTGSEVDKEIVKLVRAANNKTKSCCSRLVSFVNRLLLNATMNGYVDISDVREDPENMARKNAIRILGGERLTFLFPSKLADSERRVTPWTEGNIDGILKVDEDNSSTFAPVPDFFHAWNIPLLSTMTTTVYVRMRVSSRRSGDYVTICKKDVELIIGTAEEPQSMKLAYGHGLTRLYATGSSKKGKFYINIVPGPFRTITIASELALLASLRTGSALDEHGCLKARPNTGHLAHAFQIDKTNVSSTHLTFLAVFIEAATRVTDYENLDNADIIVEVNDQDQPGPKVGHNPEGPKDPLMETFLAEVINPLVAMSKGPIGSGLNGDAPIDVTRTTLGDRPIEAPNLVGESMIPSFTEGALVVPNRKAKEEVEKSVRERMEGKTQPTKQLTEDEKTLLDRDIADYIATMLGPECKGTASPSDPERVLEDSKPQVRREVDEARSEFVPPTQKIFVKTEATKEDKSLRFIVSTHASNRVTTATWLRGAMQAIENTPFYRENYGFGNPKMIEEKIERIQTKAMEMGLQVNETDYSAMDATVDSQMRELERRVMKHLYPKKHWAQLEKVLKDLVEENPKPLMGVKIEFHESRRSGEAFTSLFNSLINGFVHFIALKRKYKRLSVVKSWMGIYGGDDCLMVLGTSTVELDAAASRFGMKLTHTLRKPDEPSAFLAIYRDPVSGLCYPDISRVMGKMWINPERSDSRVLIRLRIEALQNRWPTTPIVKELCDKTLELLGNVKISKGQLTKYAEGAGYFNKYLGSTLFTSVKTKVDYVTVLGHMSNQLGVSITMLTEFTERIEKAKSFLDYPRGFLPSLQQRFESVTGSDYLIGDRIVPAPKNEVKHPSNTKVKPRGIKNSENGKKEK